MVLGLIGVGLVVGVHLVLSAPMRVPIIHPDELGYLDNARFLARGGLRSGTEYYPGYSIALVPLWWFTRAPELVYRGALVINAVVGGLGAVLTWALLPRLVPRVVGWRRAVVVALVCAYPPALLYGSFALAETTFAVVFAIVVLLAARAFAGASARWWAALGLSSGTLALVHPRGFAVMVAAGVLGVVVTGRRRSLLPRLGALAAGLVVGLGGVRLLVTYVKGPATSGLAAYRPDSVISKSLSVHGLASLVSELAGQLFYLSVATIGLVPLALLLGGRSLYRVLTGDRRPWVMTQAFATLSFLGVWALSSLFMNLGDRADKLVYGRYDEGVIAPLLLIAVADLMGGLTTLRSGPLHARGDHRDAARRPRARRGPLRWFIVGLSCVIVTALFVYLGHSRDALRGALNPVNVLGIYPIVAHTGKHVEVWWLSALAVGAIAVLAVLCWRWPLVTALGLAALFALSVVDTTTGYVVPGTRARAAQDVIASAIDALRGVPGVDLTCIGYEASSATDFSYYNDRFHLVGQRFEWLTATGQLSRCGTLTITSSQDFALRHPGARLVTTESYLPQSLWAVPRSGDTTFDALEGAGFLSPVSPTSFATAALPPSAMLGASLTVDPATTPGLTPGGATTLVVTVHHGPGGAPWPSVLALNSPGSARFAVRVAARWFTRQDASAAGSSDGLATPSFVTPPPGSPALGSGGSEPVDGPAVEVALDSACPVGGDSARPVACPPPVDIGHTLLPGQSLQVPVRLRASGSTGRPLPPGVYRVHLGLLQEGVASFGGPGVDVPIVVGA